MALDQMTVAEEQHSCHWCSSFIMKCHGAVKSVTWCYSNINLLLLLLLSLVKGTIALVKGTGVLVKGTVATGNHKLAMFFVVENNPVMCITVCP